MEIFFYSKIISEIFKQNKSQIEYIIQQFMNLLYENLFSLRRKKIRESHKEKVKV